MLINEAGIIAKLNLFCQSQGGGVKSWTKIPGTLRIEPLRIKKEIGEEKMEPSNYVNISFKWNGSCVSWWKEPNSNWDVNSKTVYKELKVSFGNLDAVGTKIIVVGGKVLTMDVPGPFNEYKNPYGGDIFVWNNRSQEKRTFKWIRCTLDQARKIELRMAGVMESMSRLGDIQTISRQEAGVTFNSREIESGKSYVVRISFGRIFLEARPMEDRYQESEALLDLRE